MLASRHENFQHPHPKSELNQSACTDMLKSCASAVASAPDCALLDVGFFLSYDFQYRISHGLIIFNCIRFCIFGTMQVCMKFYILSLICVHQCMYICMFVGFWNQINPHLKSNDYFKKSEKWDKPTSGSGKLSWRKALRSRMAKETTTRWPYTLWKWWRKWHFRVQ